MTPPTFAADVMLGKLSRWLRLLGFDTFYSNQAEDDFLRRLVESEGRILLTRDTELHRLVGSLSSYLVEADQPKKQLAEVARFFKLGRFAGFPRASRCPRCNGPLINSDREAVKESVPPYVYSTQEGFTVCRDCLHVYWQGTHVPRIDRFLHALWREINSTSGRSPT